MTGSSIPESDEYWKVVSSLEDGESCLSPCALKELGAKGNAWMSLVVQGLHVLSFQWAEIVI